MVLGLDCHDCRGSVRLSVEDTSLQEGAQAAHLSHFYPLCAVVHHISCDKRLQVHVQSVPGGHQVLVVDYLEEGLQGSKTRL